MALTLTSQDLKRLEDVQRTLLSPLEYPDIDAWGLDICARVEDYFGADRSAFLLPTRERLHYVSESVDSASMQGFEKGIAGADPGALRFSDQWVEQAWERRRANEHTVWTIPMAARFVGKPLDRSTMYHEAVKPAGLTFGAVMTVGVPSGEALVGVANSKVKPSEYDEPLWIDRMRLLMPAFTAGVSVLAALHAYRNQMASDLDRLGLSLALTDATGRVLHRTPALDSLVLRDPESHILEESLRRVIAECATFVRGGGAPGVGERTLTTKTAEYRIRPIRWRASPFGQDELIVVVVERTTPALPSQTQLVARYGLTPREAEVALLLARGMSNKRIARELSLSHHTIRHHAEHVFAKLGVHTRKALGLRLMDARSPPG